MTIRAFAGRWNTFETIDGSPLPQRLDFKSGLDEILYARAKNAAQRREIRIHGCTPRVTREGGAAGFVNGVRIMPGVKTIVIEGDVTVSVRGMKK